MPLISNIKKETCDNRWDTLRPFIRFNSTSERFIISVFEMEKIVMIPSILMDLDTLGNHHTQEMVDLASDVADMIFTKETGNVDLYHLFFALRSIRNDLEPKSENKGLIAMYNEKTQKSVSYSSSISSMNNWNNKHNLSSTASSSSSSLSSYFSSYSTRVLSRLEDLDEKNDDNQHMMNRFRSNLIDLKLWLEKLIRVTKYINLRYQMEIGCTD